MSATVTPGYPSQTIGSLLPPEQMGPRSVPFVLQFGTITSQLLDFTNQIQQGFLNGIQFVYCDNSASTTWTTITTGNGQQTVRIPARSGAYLPLSVPNPAQIQVTNLGSATINVVFFNYPMPACVWNTGTA
jgi:hypothetical protein